MFGVSSKEIQSLGSNTKGKLFLKAFRRSNYFTKSPFLRIVGAPYRVYYKVVYNYLLGIDIPDRTRIGVGFNVFHGQGLVVSEDSIIGSNVMIRQNTTIGNSVPGGKCPRIGNDVQIGANVVILGDISIGEGAVVAAGSVVLKDVPPNSLVAGNPAVVKKTLP